MQSRSTATLFYTQMPVSVFSLDQCVMSLDKAWFIWIIELCSGVRHNSQLVFIALRNERKAVFPSHFCSRSQWLSQLTCIMLYVYRHHW